MLRLHRGPGGTVCEDRPPSTKVNAPVPDLLPFRGLRFRDMVDLTRLAAPPYDVVDEEERAALENSDPRNAVRLILPQGGDERYASAAAALSAWRADGSLSLDDRAGLYAYRMTWSDGGRSRRTTGVIGALVLPDSGSVGDVLPHERTLPKPRSDRLDLLRATRANLDPIWALSLGSGMSECLADGALLASAVDPEGARHELSVLGDEHAAAIQAIVRSAPVLLADGHHRFETACTYRDEHPLDTGAGAIMAYVVELADDSLCVRPIHRLVTGAPTGLVDRLRDAFEVIPAGPNTPEALGTLEAAMDERGGIGLVEPRGLTLLILGPSARSAVGRLPEALQDVDGALFDVTVRPMLEGAELGYRHDAGAVAALVAKGAADAAFLLRAVTVPQIRAAALAGVRMPEKTTFFAPKPRTGLVFRLLDG